ncbi:methyltransferase family protein [Candidatus Leptofilum sp.]|uniref:methyltransferase family protein n=1 Tax=Candidatus Leptofilum sp. TaxID=3241576 RepID=UPI003B5A4A07
MKWKWGNVPIPIQYVAGLVLGAILQVSVPRPIFNDPRVGDILGLVIAAIGIGTVIWSVVAAGYVDIESPQKLVTSGPYARSRNPMMLAWTLIYVGISLVANSIWILAFLVLVILVTHFVDIPKEEQFLENQFGDEYAEYRRRVSRYL